MSHLYFVVQPSKNFLRNPWQPLADPWGSAEPRLKNTGLESRRTIYVLFYYQIRYELLQPFFRFRFITCLYTVWSKIAQLKQQIQDSSRLLKVKQRHTINKTAKAQNSCDCTKIFNNAWRRVSQMGPSAPLGGHGAVLWEPRAEALAR